MIHTFQFEFKSEYRAFFGSRNETDLSIILSDYRFRYNESETNAAFVNMGGTLNESKELEQFFLVFIWNSYASIDNIDFQKVTVV
jgi:hypothetical protein